MLSRIKNKKLLGIGIFLILILGGLLIFNIVRQHQTKRFYQKVEQISLNELKGEFIIINSYDPIKFIIKEDVFEKEFNDLLKKISFNGDYEIYYYEDYVKIKYHDNKNEIIKKYYLTVNE